MSLVVGFLEENLRFDEIAGSKFLTPLPPRRGAGHERPHSSLPFGQTHKKARRSELFVII
jgi:hypothetical protein